jgi:hypothetical protein
VRRAICGYKKENGCRVEEFCIVKTCVGCFIGTKFKLLEGKQQINAFIFLYNILMVKIVVETYK